MALGLSLPDRPNGRLRIATAAYRESEGDLFYWIVQISVMPRRKTLSKGRPWSVNRCISYLAELEP
jgi:hypothetical protein